MDASRFFQLLDRQERRWCDLKGGCDTSEFGRIGIRSDLDIRDLTICKAAGDREVVDTVTVRLPSGANGVCSKSLNRSTAYPDVVLIIESLFVIPLLRGC